ncbi:MAG: DUF3465 domain-containing protein [Candidatus Eremiobacteraeota bacterium]|nr:DUF3465 domain-containing protein [Candidatus Eremiobacteraeota bacterium]
MDFSSAYAGTRPSEVSFAATVTSAPHYFFGTHTRCEHEAFDVQTPSGPAEIIDNVDIAPRVPVHPGDRIQIRGEMVHDRGRARIVHWTHHDPQGSHEDGFIRLRGRVYA